MPAPFSGRAPLGAGRLFCSRGAVIVLLTIRLLLVDSVILDEITQLYR
jgi:hypothetical protein